MHLQKTPVRKPQPVKSNDEATSSSDDSLFDYDFAAHVVGPSVQESPVVSIPNIAVPEAGARTDSVVNTQSDNEISDGEENEESGEEPMDREVLPLDHELENRQDSTPESTESNSRQNGVNSNDSSSESNHSLQGADESSQQPRRSNRERHPPASFQSGNVSMLQRASSMESTWKEKAMFLQTLTEGGFFLKASKEPMSANDEDIISRGRGVCNREVIHVHFKDLIKCFILDFIVLFVLSTCHPQFSVQTM